MSSIANWSRRRFADTVAATRNLMRRRLNNSHPAATTVVMIGAALVVVATLVAGGGWQWVERASWVIAVALFPAAIYQLVALQRDQRRIADELSKQPDVQVGFRTQVRLAMPKIQTEFKIPPVRWGRDADLSDVVRLPLSAVNVGERTALKVLVNLVFPKGIQYLAVGPVLPEFMDEPELGLWKLMFGVQDSMGIGVTLALPVSVRIGEQFPNGFSILTHVVTLDRPYITSEILVSYEAERG